MTFKCLIIVSALGSSGCVSAAQIHLAAEHPANPGAAEAPATVLRPELPSPSVKSA